MEAVAERMVLDEELRGERRLRIERYRGRAIQLVVGEPTDGFRCGLCVPKKQVEGIAFRDGAVLTGVFRVDVGHVVPRDARDGFPVRELGTVAGTQEARSADAAWRTLDRPQDWSVAGEFSEQNPAGPEGGALPGGIGWYRKTFFAPAKDTSRLVFVEFDGVYRNSQVW